MGAPKQELFELGDPDAPDLGETTFAARPSAPPVPEESGERVRVDCHPEIPPPATRRVLTVIALRRVCAQWRAEIDQVLANLERDPRCDEER